MVGLLLGLLLVIQAPDSVENNIPVLHDSLKTTINVSGYSTEGLDLATLSGWKFKSGDDTSWADPDYDDSDWMTATGASTVFDSLFTGIGWFRLTVYVDSSWVKEEQIVRLNTYGASELYVDGKKVAHQGVPSPDPEKEKVFLPHESHLSTYQNPVEFTPGKQIVIAIRYSLHDYSLYQNTGPHNLDDSQISIQVLPESKIGEILQHGQIWILIYTIGFVLLFLVMSLHLAMYLRFHQEKGNFWIFVISGLILVPMAMFLLVEFGVMESRLVNHFYQFIFSSIFITTPMCLIPLGMGRLLQIEVRALWKYLPLLPVFIEIIQTVFQASFSGIIGIILTFSVIVIPLIGAGEILWKAKKLKRPYMWLITGALVSYPILLLIGVLLFNVFEFENNFINAVLGLFLFTTMPTGFSIYQMLRFFRAHGNLEEEVQERTAELEKAYSDLQLSLKDLKSTQQQLVQQEKLASLGQLTAGIAHEIKNPLNFVNNFSDLSVELVEEVRQELSDFSNQTSESTKKSPFGGGGSEPDGEESGNDTAADEALAILDDVEANLKKINEHGSRADGIVKSMLQHSRGGDGKMEPTDLNELIEEYVNLAFHGMRASENPINVDIELDLDEDVGEIPLIAEDFSRVIINLCNNAFDAMRKKLQGDGRPENGDRKNYKPKLIVRTSQNDEQVTIEVEDNGPGIPEDVKDKILQPFFTTKKGTEGTGLGLSITNDIIKAHGGSIAIDSKRVRGTGIKVRINKP